MIQKEYNSIVKDITKKGEVVIMANAFNNIDSQKDVSLPGSFKKTIKENFKNIYWFKNHNSDETLGVIKKLWETDQFLNSEMKFNLDKQIAKDMYSDYQFFAENDRMVKHSVGLSTIDGKYEIKNGIRYVKEWKLWEISSLTKWAANDLAGTASIKNIENININETLKNLNIYYEWMSKKGIHSDEHILRIEKNIKNLVQLINEPSDDTRKETKPSRDTLRRNIILNLIK